MPTGNYDSSYITQRRNAMTLYAFNNANQVAVNAGGVQRGCFCSDINNGNVYNFGGPGGCGCGTK